MFQYSDQYLKWLIDGIFAGRITHENLPISLYMAIGDYLKKGLYEGYGFSLSSLSKEIGKGKMNLEDLELLAEMRANIYMFSAAKTYQQVKEMTEALVDSKGTVVPYNQFKEQANQIFKQYNETWLKTEYDTAIGQGQSAMTWRQIEKDAEVLPLLKYDAIMDKNTSDICRPLDGLVAPVNDPVWKKIMPLNHFNCRCIVRQLEAGEKITSEAKKATMFNEATEKMQDVFKMNAGMDGYVFKKDHPYFTVPKKDKELAANNFNLPIPKNDTPQAQEIAFKQAKSIKEAEEYAKTVLGCKYANFKNVDLEVANDMNRGLFNTKVFMPELQVNGIGSAQECNKAIKAEIIETYRQSEKYKIYKQNFGQEFAEDFATKLANSHVSKVSNGILAWSQNKGVINVGGTQLDLSKYKGVFVNEKVAKSKEKLDQIVTRNAAAGWFTKGAKDFSYIMDHELGHEIDKLLKIRDDEDFLKIFNREHKAGVKVLAEKLSTYGATAGNNPAHRRHEMIAEAWAEFTTSSNPRPLANEIGELMMRKYYTNFKQGTGTTFEQWKAETLKTIRK